jgi:DNA-binding XRE family transcriptional regulator
VIRLDSPDRLAGALQGMRADADPTQKGLSALTGIATTTISTVERGVNGCTVATLIALLDAAGYDLALIKRVAP